MRTKVLRAAALFLPLLVLGGCTPAAGGAFFPTSTEYFTQSSIQQGGFDFPEPRGLLTIDIETNGQDLPESKDDGELPVEIAIDVDGLRAETPGTIKVQGSSTEGWPKKNWTLKLYADESREDALPIKVGNSVPSTEWVAKAEWIDPSQIRNLLSYRLWDDMVATRTGLPQLEVDNSDGPAVEGAQGYPVTELAQVLIDGEHYGIATLTLGHDPQNFNIDPENPHHVYMEFDARSGNPPDVKTWAKFAPSGIGPHVESYLSDDNEFTEEQVAAIDRLGLFINGPLDEFQDNYDDYFDKSNMIDMLLFMEMIYDWDAVAQDIEMVTYDLNKWYFLPWDKDTTFGLSWDGSGLMDGSEDALNFNYNEEEEPQKPWAKTYRSLSPQVEARYAQLRERGVFTAENIRAHANDLYARVPAETWEAERARWEPEGRPSLDETDANQIVDWFEARLVTLDEHFNYRPAGAR